MIDTWIDLLGQWYEEEGALRREGNIATLHRYSDWSIFAVSFNGVHRQEKKHG